VLSIALCCSHYRHLVYCLHPATLLVSFCVYSAVAGSLLDALSAAVENARIVFVCFSEKYRNSHFCKAGYFSYHTYTFRNQSVYLVVFCDFDHHLQPVLHVLFVSPIFIYDKNIPIYN